MHLSFTVTNTSGKHYYLVKGKLLTILHMLEGKKGTADQGWPNLFPKSLAPFEAFVKICLGV